MNHPITTALFAFIVGNVVLAINYEVLGAHDQAAMIALFIAGALLSRIKR